MQLNEDLFLDRYNKLNERQREAVDTIYGPVMVIAGPGTGKTEVLSMRIAALLRSEAQVQPHEILCLTYTDEATNSMRRRLVQIIGPAAHKIYIPSTLFVIMSSRTTARASVCAPCNPLLTWSAQSYCTK